jgi:hypothetical protein
LVVAQHSQFPVLLDLGPDVDPRAAIGDKGYDSNASRLAANRIRSGGSTPARCALPRRQCIALLVAGARGGAKNANLGGALQSVLVC